MNQFFSPDDVPCRVGTNSIKWDDLASHFSRSDLLPLWVADMDFYSPPCIRKAMEAAAAEGIYGYFSPPPSYQEAFLNWELEHHGVQLKKEWLRFTPGVVTGIYFCISSLTEPGDAVAVLTPCYYPFMNAVNDTGRTLVTSNLIPSGDGYTFDPADLEQVFRDRKVRMLLLCSPHNPVGHVWSEEELLGILGLCRRYGVIVVSDEIHQDITFGGNVHHSSLRYEEHLMNTVMLTSGSKTFNIAGLQNSFAVIPNKDWRGRFDRYTQSVNIRQGVSLGYIAAEAGFRDGYGWLEEIREYLYENYKLLKTLLEKELPGAKVHTLEGTYLAWVNLSGCVRPEDLVDVVENRAHLAVDYGFWFWPEGMVPEGDAHIRINLACPRKNIKKAAEQLIAAVSQV